MVRYQSKSPNFNVTLHERLRKQSFSNNNHNMGAREKFLLAESRLPVKNNSKSMTHRNSKKHSIEGIPKLNKIGSVSTLSDFSSETEKMKSYTNSPSVVNERNPILVAIKSRNDSFKWGQNSHSRCPPKTLKRFQIPKHRNNSSCGKLTQMDFQPIVKAQTSPTFKKQVKSLVYNNHETRSRSDLERKGVLKEISNKCPTSIFRLFKMKINLYREKCQIVDKKDVNPQNVVSNKNTTDTTSNKGEGYKVFEQAKNKNFLLSLYDECRKLNNNIVKLSSDTNNFNTRFKSLQTVENLLSKYNSIIHNESNIKIKRSQSNCSINKGKSSSNNESVLIESGKLHQRSQSDYVSAKGFCKTLEENNGHYYHLACVLATDHDQINSSENDTNNNEKETKFSSLHESKKSTTMVDENTNVLSQKSKSITNAKTEEKEVSKIENQSKEILNNLNNIHENDDTLCDLDEDMETDSMEDIKENPKLLKSPASESSYLTAIDNLTVTKSKNRDLTKHKVDANITSTSFELPSAPTNKDYGFGNNSQISYPDIDPPVGLNKLLEDCASNGNEFSSKVPVSQFVTVFEKQFPQRVVLVKNSNKITKPKSPEVSRFTSSITVNCYKEERRVLNTGTTKSDDIRRFFNPFKPPKYNTLKLMQFLNSNNNSADTEDFISPLNNHNDELQVERVNHSPNLQNIENNDNSSADVPLKRVAPLDQLLMHSINSDKMNSVFSFPDNENRTSPTNQSCIEKQRQKKLLRQKEQHQKAKDMAVEAAKVRKERQSELQSFDSFDSTRIVDRLFTDNNDKDYPEFSLYDACHYNFIRKRTRKPKPPIPSTINGILPEEPPKSPERPKSPLTTEKFRNEPIQLVKRIHVKKEFSKVELEKYEPVSNIKPVTQTVVVEKPKLEATPVQSTGSKSKSESSVSDTSSSTTTEEESDSVTSDSSESSSKSSTESSDSSQSTPDHSKNHKHSHSKSHSRSKKPKKKSSKSKNKSKKNVKEKKVTVELETEKVKENEESKTELKTNSLSQRTENNVDKPNKINGKPVANNQWNRFENVTFEDLINFKKEKTISTVPQTIDATVNTDTENKEIIFPVIEVDETQILETHGKDVDVNVVPEYHPNHIGKYNENILDRSLSVKINIPVPNTSLSGFVQELNSQLNSLADTVDILMNRMKSFEANLLDISKHFVYK